MYIDCNDIDHNGDTAVGLLAIKIGLRCGDVEVILQLPFFKLTLRTDILSNYYEIGLS